MVKRALRFVSHLILPCLALLGVGYAVFYSLSTVTTAESRDQNALPPPTVTRILAGAGLVEPKGQTISVAAPLPGVVDWVIGLDRVGTTVAKGEKLLTLDTRQQQAELRIRKAQLASAQAALTRLKNMPRKEDLEPLKARYAEAKAEADNKTQLYERALALRKNNVVTVEEVVDKKFSTLAAEARVAAALAEYRQLEAGTWDYDIRVAEEAIKLAEAQVAQIETDLDRLIVCSSAELTLLKVDVRPQEFVGVPPGKTLMLLGNIEEVNIRVYIDEHDASRFRPGMPGSAHLQEKDATAVLPLEYVRHEPIVVEKPALTGLQTERIDVRVLPVIYRFLKAEDQKRVFVGQQVDVFLKED